MRDRIWDEKTVPPGGGGDRLAPVLGPWTPWRGAPPGQHQLVPLGVWHSWGPLTTLVGAEGECPSHIDDALATQQLRAAAPPCRFPLGGGAQHKALKPAGGCGSSPGTCPAQAQWYTGLFVLPRALSGGLVEKLRQRSDK